VKPIPLFGPEVTSYSAVVTRQRRVNVMYDVRKGQDRAAIVAVGTPGAVSWITLPASPIWGWRVIGSLMYVVAGKHLYTVSTGGVITDLGTMPTINNYVGMTDDSVTLEIADGIAGYSVNLGTGVISTIVDANFPNGAYSIDVLNSHVIAPIPGTRKFRISGLLAGATWSPEVYGTKENASDLLIALDVINGVLILWGDTSFEQWQDVGAYPMPYQRIQGGTQMYGLAAGRSRVKIDNSIIFLGKTMDGGVKVMRLMGGQVAAISDSDIEYIISNFSVITDAVGMSYTAYGHAVYQLTFPTVGRTLAFDTFTGIWHEAQTTAVAQARHFANLSVAFNGKNYVSDTSTGIIYQLDEDAYTDNGAVIPREVCTRHIRNAGNEVFLERLFLDFDTGIGNTAASNPQVLISVSRDGGRTFGPEKYRALGTVGTYRKRVTVNRLGSGFDMVAKIRVTDAVKFVVCSGSAVIEGVDA
jgi:hypothetical protein